MNLLEHGLHVHHQRCAVDLFTGHGHFEIRVGGCPRVTLDDRVKQVCQRIAHLLVELTGHPEIDQTQPSIGQDKEIAGMRVGVKQTFLKDGLQHHPYQGSNHLRHRFRMLFGVEIYPFAVRKLQREHCGARIL